MIILNFPYGQKDREDVDELISRGLGLNIRAKSVHRAPSKGYNAGVLTIELASQDDKADLMRNKYKLRRNDRYSNVYIDSVNPHRNIHVENSFHVLIQDMHDKVFRGAGRSNVRNGRNRTY